ncbi:hypothetical protein B0H13DRAFT_1927663 [Mycena leptocephala]|nr:hypothetical protein B0H13DRAFT_1927663 [Mycena leptocephala]
MHFGMVYAAATKYCCCVVVLPHPSAASVRYGLEHGEEYQHWTIIELWGRAQDLRQTYEKSVNTECKDATKTRGGLQQKDIDSCGASASAVVWIAAHKKTAADTSRSAAACLTFAAACSYCRCVTIYDRGRQVFRLNVEHTLQLNWFTQTTIYGTAAAKSLCPLLLYQVQVRF